MGAGGDGEWRDIRVQVVDGPVVLPGDLIRPDRPAGCVLFCHGSGSSRFSPRNRAVAEVLADAGFAALLFDLLTETEAADWARVFDIAGLAGRVLAAVDWAAGEPALGGLPLGLFGASTGAAAAIVAAAERPGTVGAVVSRGGRPDLAGAALARLRCPTLLIVGGADAEVLALNRRALDLLDCPKALSVVPGATHLFAEPGALEAVADLAADWFRSALVPSAGGAVRSRPDIGGGPST